MIQTVPCQCALCDTYVEETDLHYRLVSGRVICEACWAEIRAMLEARK